MTDRLAPLITMDYATLDTLAGQVLDVLFTDYKSKVWLLLDELIAQRPASAEKDEEIEEAHQLRERLVELLTGVAAGLKGEPPPDTLHDWSGLPRLAAQVVQERDRLAASLQEVRERKDQRINELIQRNEAMRILTEELQARIANALL